MVTLPLTDDFEGTLDNWAVSLNGGGSAVDIVASNAFRGSHSLHCIGYSADATAKVQASISGAPIVYIRAYYKFSQLPVSGGTFSGDAFMILSSLSNDADDNALGACIQYVDGSYHWGLVNIVNGAFQVDFTSATTINTGVYYCIEIMRDITHQTTSLWIDGTLVLNITGLSLTSNTTLIKYGLDWLDATSPASITLYVDDTKAQTTYIGPDSGLSQTISDSLVVGSLIQKNSIKNMREIIAISDVSKISFTKKLSDAYNIASSTLQSIVSNVFSQTVIDSIIFLESIRLTTTKRVTETLSVADLSLKTITKVQRDFISGADSQIKNFVKTWQDSLTFWSNWQYKYASIGINAGVGAGVNYQLIFYVHREDGINYSEVVNGETIWHLYVGLKCKADYTDLRFCLHGSTIVYAHKICKIIGNYAVFVVKINEDLDSAQFIDYYYGNAAAPDVSSDAVFVDVISGVVGAWTLDEADQEVNPTVIVDPSNTTFWSLNNTGTGTLGLTISNDDTQQIAGHSTLKLSWLATGGTYSFVSIAHAYGNGNLQNWSTKNKIRLYWYGSNSENNYQVVLQFGASAATGTVHYQFVDNFTGLQALDIPFGSFVIDSGTFDSTQVYFIQIKRAVTLVANTTTWIGRIIADVGVTAVDYSGYGNNGAATGTTIEAGKHAGKNGRRTNGLGDFIKLASKIDLPNGWTVLAWFKRSGNAGGTGSGQHGIVANIYGDASNYLQTGTANTISPAYNTLRTHGTPEWLGDQKSLANDSNWHLLGSQYDPTTKTLKTIVDTAISTGTTHTDVIYAGALPPQFGKIATLAEFANGVFSGVYFFDNPSITQTQIANIYNNYPDVSLDPGKALVRKYASTTLPSLLSWGTEINNTRDTAINLAKAISDAIKIIDETRVSFIKQLFDALQIADFTLISRTLTMKLIDAITFTETITASIYHAFNGIILSLSLSKRNINLTFSKRNINLTLNKIKIKLGLNKT